MEVNRQLTHRDSFQRFKIFCLCIFVLVSYLDDTESCNETQPAESVMYKGLSTLDGRQLTCVTKTSTSSPTN